MWRAGLSRSIDVLQARGVLALPVVPDLVESCVMEPEERIEGARVQVGHLVASLGGMRKSEGMRHSRPAQRLDEPRYAQSRAALFYRKG
jgi:hypothetical protein